MKVGMRTPSFKKSFKALTTGKYKRKLKRMVNPFYGKKGMGWIKDPSRALKNKIYHKTTFSAMDASKGIARLIYLIFYLMWLCLKYSAIAIWLIIKYFVLATVWLITLLVNAIITLIELIINIGKETAPLSDAISGNSPEYISTAETPSDLSGK